VFDLALDTLVGVIRKDLEQFGVTYDEWFSERSLTEQGLVDRAIETLREKGHVYEREGAQWFRSTAFGDEKDRVVRRDNGQTTYFASDIAYHMNKFDRGFDEVINVWGADHHGYIARVKAALQALDYPADKLEILLVQFANLYENGEMVPMSTRSGEFVTLRELREDVGKDAARFFYVMRKAEQHMDFDLDLARKESSDNPVYYVQYAHARVCSVERQCAEQDVVIDLERAELEKLDNTHEQALLKLLALYPERPLSRAAAGRRGAPRAAPAGSCPARARPCLPQLVQRAQVHRRGRGPAQCPPGAGLRHPAGDPQRPGTARRRCAATDVVATWARTRAVRPGCGSSCC